MTDATKTTLRLGAALAFLAIAAVGLAAAQSNETATDNSTADTGAGVAEGHALGSHAGHVCPKDQAADAAAAPAAADANATPAAA